MIVTRVVWTMLFWLMTSFSMCWAEDLEQVWQEYKKATEIAVQSGDPNKEWLQNWQKRLFDAAVRDQQSHQYLRVLKEVSTLSNSYSDWESSIDALDLLQSAGTGTYWVNMNFYAEFGSVLAKHYFETKSEERRQRAIQMILQSNQMSDDKKPELRKYDFRQYGMNLLLLGRLYRHGDVQDYKLAAETFQEIRALVRESPKHFSSWPFWLEHSTREEMRAWLDAGEYEKADTSLEELIKVSKEGFADNYFVEYANHVYAADPKKYQAFLENAESRGLDSGVGDLLYELGRSYQKSEDWDKAISTYQRIRLEFKQELLARDKTTAPQALGTYGLTLKELADCYEKTRQTKEELEAWKEFTDLFPNHQISDSIGKSRMKHLSRQLQIYQPISERKHEKNNLTQSFSQSLAGLCG